MNRRHFLIATGVGAAALGAPIAWHWRSGLQDPRPVGNFLVGASNDRPKQDTQGYRRVSERTDGFINRVDFQNDQITSLKVPIFPHGFGFDATTGLLVTTQKWGDLAVVTDSSLTSIKKVIEIPAKASFSGHGIFIENGKTLVISGETEAGHGVILFYDVGQDFALMKSIETPRRIHELRALDSQTLLVGVLRPLFGSDAYGEQGAVQRFDLRSGQLGDFLAAPESSHILPITASQYVIGGINGVDKPLALGFVDWSNRKTVAVTESKDFGNHPLVGEALSLAYLDRQHVAFTAPDSSRIGVWNFIDNRIASLKLSEKPLGLFTTPEGEMVVNSDDKEFKSFRYNGLTHRIEPVRSLLKDVGNGRHIYLQRA